MLPGLGPPPTCIMHESKLNVQLVAWIKPRRMPATRDTILLSGVFSVVRTRIETQARNFGAFQYLRTL